MDAIPRPDGPDDNLGASFIIFQWTLAGIAAVVLALRLFTAGAILRKISPADYLMAISFLCAIICGILVTKSYQWGLGRHIRFLTEKQIIQALKYATLQAGFSAASSALARISFCLFMLRFVTEGFIRSSLWLSIIAQVIINLIFIVLTYSACGVHITAEWDYHVQAHCLGIPVLMDYTYLLFVCNSATDLFLTVLPSAMLHSLRISLMKRVAIILLLSLSVFAFVASIVKATMIGHIVALDSTWALVKLYYWAAAESYIVIIAPSVPILNALVKRSVESISSSPRNQTRATEHNTVQSKSREKSYALYPMEESFVQEP